MRPNMRLVGAMVVGFSLFGCSSAAPNSSVAPIAPGAQKLDPRALTAIPPYQGPLPGYADKAPAAAEMYRWAATHRAALL